MFARLNRTGILFAVLIILLAALPLSTIQAQGGGNMLQNPGFEGFYRSFNYQEATRGLVLEFRLADGWRPWFREQGPDDPSWRYRRPEYRPASYSYNGTAAQQFFTSFSTHQAGFYQQVGGVNPGQSYRFNIAAYVWSSMGGDFFRSEQPGGVSLRVGIDPTGGTNPWAASVVWSPFATYYDTWRVLSVDAVAQASTATVFVWSSQQSPVVHNDSAWDEAFFGLASDAPAAGAAPASEETAVEPAPAAPAPVVVSPTGVTMTANSGLRLRARLYGPTLDVIPAGTTLPVLGRSEDLNWTMVDYNGQQGWVASWLGSYSAVFESLPVVSMP